MSTETRSTLALDDADTDRLLTLAHLINAEEVDPDDLSGFVEIVHRVTRHAREMSRIIIAAEVTR